MRLLRSAVLYTALLAGANAAAGTWDPAAVEAARAGDMLKLNLVAAKPVPDVAVLDAAGGEHRLADWRGEWVVLNFWATWCAPCREEMPSLDRLQADLGKGGAENGGLEVVTIATGRNAVPAIERFFAETGVETLPILLDPQGRLAREMGVLGLPVTVILDPEGREVARLLGEAEWDGEDARAVLAAFMADAWPE